MTTYVTVMPAYGRDYKNKKDALADWNAGKDFYAQGVEHSGYVSKVEAEALGLTIMIRYNRLTRITSTK